MTTKTIYIAYDGVEYDNEQECRDFEDYAWDMYNNIITRCEFIENGNKLYLVKATDNLNDALFELEKAYHACDKIILTDELSDSAWCWVYNEIGIYLPEGGAGVYEYWDCDWRKVS